MSGVGLPSAQPASEGFNQRSNVVNICYLDESLAAGHRMKRRPVRIVRPVESTLNTLGCYNIKPEGYSKQCDSMIGHSQALEHTEGTVGVCTLLQNSKAGIRLNPDIQIPKARERSGWQRLRKDVFLNSKNR